MNNDDEEDEEREQRPRAARLDSKKAKELIANMFTDKDEDFLSSDDEETKKILVKERVLNKAVSDFFFSFSFGIPFPVMIIFPVRGLVFG